MIYGPDEVLGRDTHPHCQPNYIYVHAVVTGGGLSNHGRWLASRPDFLVPVKALSPIFRAKFRDELRKTQLFAAVEARVWKKDWVVHSQPVGSGEAAFKYLAPYIFRVAISNNRILKLEDGRVTFKYKESATHQTRFSTVTAPEFIRRFLQHVLPPRYVKVRYYGLLSPSNHHLLNRVRALPAAPRTNDATTAAPSVSKAVAEAWCCKCGSLLLLVETLPRLSRAPP